jgi:hypothetical protein
LRFEVVPLRHISANTLDESGQILNLGRIENEICVCSLQVYLTGHVRRFWVSILLFYCLAGTCLRAETGRRTGFAGAQPALDSGTDEPRKANWK